MKKTVLIIGSNPDWIAKSEEHLLSNGFHSESACTGKEGQLKAFKNKPNYVFLDLEVKDFSGIEVLKYLHLNCHGTIVFAFTLVGDNSGSIDEKIITRLGAVKILFGLDASTLSEQIKSLGKLTLWKDIQPSTEPSTPLDQEENIIDQQFTRIRMNEFFQDVMAVSDLYIRLGANRYVKIVNRGEKTTSERFKKYAENGAEYLYFATKDRLLYINYQNELASQEIKNSDNTAKVIKSMKSAHDKLIEEIMNSGVQPELLEEGKNICLNLYNAAMKKPKLKAILQNLEEFNPQLLSESFMVSFFSTVICKDLEWVGAKTINTLALGALLHDVGILKLNQDMVEKDKSLLSPEETALYQSHPTLGIETLKDVPDLNSGVLEIVLQHHERMDTSGFPKRLSGNKIYPLAKIVGLADGFTSFLKISDMSAIDAAKEFIKDPVTVAQYDSILIKNLIRGMIT